ncbi:hypothetical protein B9479_008099 [Cryptococcus floricola]|uniref:Uncharacterized protein n=1 Tax=Cryptococcus floricola TaxID=2591691 RepID=A0A5D3AK04_9TREE|nr:hypothetical protein B9479_008099 [Cryptococcus floricola]
MADPGPFTNTGEPTPAQPESRFFRSINFLTRQLKSLSQAIPFISYKLRMDNRTPFPLLLLSSDPRGRTTAPLYDLSTIPPACIPTSTDDALECVTFGPRYFYNQEKEAKTTDLRQVDRHASLDMEGLADRATDDQEATSDPSTTRNRNARRFWQILNPDHVFTFRYDPEVVPQLVRGLRTVVNHLPTPSSLDESLALNELVQFLFLLENGHSVFLPETLRRFEEDPSFGFDTYEQRDKKGGSDVVRLVRDWGQEEGSTASPFTGEYQAANIYAKHLSRLAAAHSSTLSWRENRIYKYAPPVVSGDLHLAARPDPDPDAEREKIQVTTSTKLGIEHRFHITLRDLFMLFYVLLHDQINVNVNPLDGKPTVQVSEEVQGMLSSALIAILAQLAQEFHVNRCEYINLAVHDFSITFQLMGRNTAHVSRIVFRDPATAKRDILSEDELTNILSGIRSETKRTAAVRTLLESKPWETEAQNSLFAVLVAGLVLPVGEDTTSMWMDGEKDDLSRVE